MRRTRFGATVYALLSSRADPVVRRNYEWYFQGAVRFIGLKTPEIRKVTREVEPQLRSRPVADLVAECFRLLRSPYAEEKHVAIALLGRNVHCLPPGFLAAFEPVFDATVHDWGACDHIASRILRQRLVASPRDRARVVGWRLASHPWRQRAAAVAFVHEARHGRYTREILTVCGALVRNPDRFVQLGMGWVLRELSQADRARTLRFLAVHYPRINREALRYAVEKLPVDIRRKVLNDHHAAAASAVAPARSSRARS
jgi:3-methyladenine DNA glycosylase AlkD